MPPYFALPINTPVPSAGPRRAEPSTDHPRRPGDAHDHVGAQDNLAAATHALLERAQLAPADEGRELRGQAVINYLWLADRIARRYAGRGEDDDDLIQVARSGLVEAANRFDVRCASFPAFAVPTVTGVVKRHFRDHGWLVRPPRTTQETATELARSWPELAQQLARDPDDRSAAKQIGRLLEKVREARVAGRGYSAASLDFAMESGRSFVSEDARADGERAEARIVIGAVWPRITEDERRLLAMRFGEGRSQSEIASEIGTSQMQVSRLLNRTLRKLRTMIAGSETAALV